MKTVWKYQLEPSTMQTIPLPNDAIILCVQRQYNVPCLWALVDTTHAKGTRYITIIGTGHQLPEKLDIENYIGTFQSEDGTLVLHAFEGN